MIFYLLLILFSVFSLNACDISGIPKDELLRALYSGAVNPKAGMQALHQTGWAELLQLDHLLEGTAELSLDEARQLLHRKNKYIEYVKGCPIKMDLSGDTCRTTSYNNEHGHGKAEKIISDLRQQFNSK